MSSSSSQPDVDAVAVALTVSAISAMIESFNVFIMLSFMGLVLYFIIRLGILHQV